MTDSTICPFCSSNYVTFKTIAKVWECNQCEERFEGPILKAPAVSPPITPQTIFLSYAHKSEKPEDFDISEELVLLVKEALEKDGHEVWIDKEGIRANDNWRERITKEILDRKHFLSFLSKRSTRESGVCLSEIEIAIAGKKRIQTIMTEPEGNLKPPLTVTCLQCCSFEHWNEIRDGSKKGSNGEGWEEYFSQRIEDIKNALLDVQAARADSEIQRLRNVLDPKTFEAQIIENIKGFYGREWLIKECHDWLNNADSRIFWIKGSPGIGKSAFASKLTHTNNSSVVAYYECNFQSRKDEDLVASECIKSISYQLATRLPDYRIKLLYLNDLSKDNLSKKTADDLFQYLLLDPLLRFGKIKEDMRFAIVIDGLDEAGQSGGSNSLADLFEKYADQFPEWLGLIITSRPEPELERMMSSFHSTAIQGNSAHNVEDIKSYINSKLDITIAEPKRSEIIEAVHKKSNGLFLYFALIAKSKSYDLTNPDSLPDGIDDFFRINFKRYFSNEKTYAEEVEPFLSLMVASPGPLPQAMAQIILGKTERDINREVREPLASLLEDREEGLVFFHKSLSDWLLSYLKSGVYVVSDTGNSKLSQFIWQEYRNFDNSLWKRQVLQWLSILITYTEHWNMLDDLDEVATFFNANLCLKDEAIVRKRHYELTIEKYGDISKETFFSMINYGDCMLGSLTFKFESFFRRALEISIAVFESGDENQASIMTKLAQVQIMRQYNGCEEAKSLFNQALDIYNNKFQGGHYKKMYPLIGLADILVIEKQHGDARKLYEDALHYFTGDLPAPPEAIPAAIEAFNGLAYLNGIEGNYPEAEKTFRNLIDIYQNSFGHDHPSTIRPMIDLADLLNQAGRYLESEQMANQALKISISVFGEEDAFTLRIRRILAISLENQERLADATVIFREVLETTKKLSNLESLAYRHDLYNLSVVLYKQRLISEAKTKSQEAIRISKLHNDSGLVEILCSLAKLNFNNKLYKNAEELYLEVLKIDRGVFEPDDPKIASSLYDLATCYIYQGNFDVAKPMLIEALDINQRKLGQKNGHTAVVRSALGQILCLQKNFFSAIPHLINALEILKNKYGIDHRHTISCHEALNFARKSVRLTKGASKNLMLKKP